MTIKFVYENPAETMKFSSTERVEIEVNDLGATLDELCSSFRDFVRACGYELPPGVTIAPVDQDEH
jgi:hypothetical protein